MFHTYPDYSIWSVTYYVPHMLLTLSVCLYLFDFCWHLASTSQTRPVWDGLPPQRSTPATPGRFAVRPGSPAGRVDGNVTLYCSKEEF